MDSTAVLAEAHSSGGAVAYLRRPFRILGVLDQWLSGEHFDHSLGSELQGFLTRDVKADPGFQDSPQVQSMLERLEQMLSNLNELIAPMVRTVYGSQPNTDDTHMKRVHLVIYIVASYG